MIDRRQNVGQNLRYGCLGGTVGPVSGLILRQEVVTVQMSHSFTGDWYLKNFDDTDKCEIGP
jgi:hypothetical protein